MRHLRSDWDGIQDTRQGEFGWNADDMSSIRHDEPVFLLRAKDPAAWETVISWADLVERQGGDPELCKRVREWGREMLVWRQENYPAPKTADVPEGKLRD